MSNPAWLQNLAALKAKIAAASQNRGWNEGWNQNCPWGAKCTDAACAFSHPPDREDPGVSAEYLEELKTKMRKISGSARAACKFGYTCNKWDCKNFHQEGRAIEENPESIVCKFKRNCMRKDCYFHHPTGRSLDDDPAKGVCHYGSQCTNPNCIFQHPDDPSRNPPKPKQPRNSGPCNFCGESGHVRRECPQIPGNRLRAEAFPADWMTIGSESLTQNIIEYLSTFGSLSKPPEISDDFASAILYFDSQEDAKLAVQLTGDNGPFVLKFYHEDGHKGSREEFSIHVGNLNPSTTEPELKEFCEEVGVVKSCRIVRDGKRKFKSDYGFCDFFDDCTRQAAVDILNGKLLLGNILRIRAQEEDRRNIQYAELSGFPDWVWDLDHSEIAQRVTEIVATIGQTGEAPEVDGNIVRIQFLGQPLDSHAWLDFEGGKLEIIPCQRPSGAKRRKKEKECSIFIGNISHDCSEEEIANLCSEFGDVDFVRIPRSEHNRSRGYAFCQFRCKETVELAALSLHEKEFKGRRLRVQGKGEKEKEEGRSRSRSRSPRGRHGGKIIHLHVDELEMPLRPDVEPSPGQCEVWLEKMPEEESDDWVSKFGEVEEVFRLANKEHGGTSRGTNGDRGYVKFHDHEAAKRCIEAGVATWSESERILHSNSSERMRQASVYPKSVISMMLGRGGQRMLSLKDELGLDVLALRGKGVGDSRSEAHSKHLHFFCKGPRDVIDKVQPVLEQLLAEVHNDLAEILANPSLGGRPTFPSADDELPPGEFGPAFSERSSRNGRNKGLGSKAPPPPPPIFYPPPSEWQQSWHPSPPPPGFYQGMVPHAGASRLSGKGPRPSCSKEYEAGDSANRADYYIARPSSKSSARGRPSSRHDFE